MTPRLLRDAPGVYLIRCVVSDKVYIGSASNISIRWHHHRKDLESNKHHSKHLQAAYNYYGADNFQLEVLENTVELRDREQHWMDIFESYNPEKGYNHNREATVSLGMLGKNHSEEVRKRISETNKGKHGGFSAEQKAEIVRRRRAGESYHSLSKAFDVDMKVIYRTLRDAGLVIGRR